jgi:hypothetical protein
VDRTELLTAASKKLAEAVVLLTEAGEDRLAAHVEDLIQQIELSIPHGNTPPNTNSHR